MVGLPDVNGRLWGGEVTKLRESCLQWRPKSKTLNKTNSINDDVVAGVVLLFHVYK